MDILIDFLKPMISGIVFGVFFGATVTHFAYIAASKVIRFIVDCVEIIEKEKVK
jgi:hypothetical protein